MKYLIYKITNKVNGDFYIGSSFDIPQRWKSWKKLAQSDAPPYKSKLYCEQADWYLNIEGDEYFIHLGESPDVEYTFIRNAWSWECIRLYLLSKGYVYYLKLLFSNELENEINAWYFHVYHKGNKVQIGWENTYEECREAAILFILNELKIWD